METRSNSFLVLAVTGLLLGTLVFTLWLLEPRNGNRRPYMIRFSGSVAGIEKGSPVTFSGVPAGHVTSVEFDSQDPSVVLVAVNLEPEIPIVTGVKATIVRSALGGTANISLDGATHDALPIVAAKDGEFPIIPAKEGGLLGGGGDPIALVEKISRTVDSVSLNLGAAQQQRASERLAALAHNSAGWADKVGTASEGLMGARGRMVTLGEGLQRSGNRAESLRVTLKDRGPSALAKANRKLGIARDSAEGFAARAEALRPEIERATAQQDRLVETIGSVRGKVSAVRETAVRIDQEGLGLGSPSLPTYKPDAEPGK
ncbi:MULTISPECIES: MlaD family protein [Alphaproteobacteria]|jgi:phospholipid/cholesterol/gamma-HCH transport system substrate-binding protein|uniref:MCE family protein n=1 Tax=Sphingobium yanoikuyae TaxID=13690 RepID=A0A3G2UMA5_SPHYA|nr:MULTISPECIES: MlaD family protein [Sphingomonadaceae]AYO75714.1 MCE family protein [Sphingobium yanoikuyae]GFE77736.1 hypothetical protein NTCA1_53850 [Novosphingobium sp. TCA1]